MRCERCRVGLLVFVHDVAVDGHSWEPGHEGACGCSPVPLCVICEGEALARDGFILLPRPAEVRCLAPSSALRH